MPEIRNYTVTQERELKVSANSPIDAARIANAVFKGEDPAEVLEDIFGHATSPIRNRDIVAREDYS